MSRSAKSRSLLLLALSLSSAPLLPLHGQSPEKRIQETLAPGLRHIAIQRGRLATRRRFRVLAGSFDRQAEADQVLRRLQETGARVNPHYLAGRYRLSIDGFPNRREADEESARLERAGFPGLAVEVYLQDTANPEGPWEIHVLEADPQAVRVQVAHAYDAAIGLETLSGMARRLGALAAVNGGFFLQEGILRGEAQGVLKVEGSLLSEPDRGRAAVGFYQDGAFTRAVFGRLGFAGRLIFADGKTLAVDGLNRERGEAEVLIYTPEFHRTTLTSPDGTEVLVESGRVAAIRENAGSSSIPGSGFVASLGASRVSAVLPLFRVGDPLSLVLNLNPLLPDPGGGWPRARFVVGGGPVLLFEGRRIEEPEVESVSSVFFLARHPRTAAGVRADGTLLVLTVDGRQPERSVGMSLRELTDLLLELGAVSALNLDGGGSSTMVIRGHPVNSPSDPTGERETGDAILLYPRGEEAIS